MPLADEHAGMVNGLRQAALEDLSLETTLQEVLDLQGQHVIEAHAGLIEHTDADETADEGVTLEKTLGILIIELEQLTSCTTNLGEDETDAPNLALVAKTILAGELYRDTQNGFTSDRPPSQTFGEVRTFSSASRRADSNGRRGTL